VTNPSSPYVSQMTESKFQVPSKYQKHSKKQKASKQAIKEASKKAKLAKVCPFFSLSKRKLEQNLKAIVVAGSIQPQDYH
jgi:hypothetical protein